MNLPRTESRIPGGFTLENAQKLGFAVLNGDHCMVSFSPKTLRLGEPVNFLSNYYVVFTNAAPNTNLSYQWKFEYIEDDDANPFLSYTETVQLLKSSTYWFRSEEQGFDKADIPRLKKLKVTCTVTHQGQGTDLVLEHKIEGLFEDILKLHLDSESDVNIAEAGNPYTTHYIANRYRDFFPSDPKWEGNNIDIPLNIPFGIIYARILGRQQLYNKSYEQNLNDDALELSDNFKRNLVGACALKPHLAAIALGAIPFQRLGDGTTELDIFNAFNALEATDVTELNKIDIYNYARFPKTNILLAAYTMSEFMKKAQANDCANYYRKQGNASDWKDLQKDEIKNEDEFAANFLTEYSQGPQQSISEFLYQGIGMPLQHDWAPYTQEVLDRSYIPSIPYETVKIKVLDIRSGQPIQDARVKRVIIKGADNHLIKAKEDNLPYDRDQITDSNRLSGAKTALYRWGYLVVSEVNHVYQPWEPTIAAHAEAIKTATKKAFKDYASDRSLDGLFDSDDQPPDAYLDYIIEEYNEQAFTDQNGILRIRIPKAFLEHEDIHVEVGFWEFPIALEQLHGNAEDNSIIRENHLHSATNFDISWLEDESLQETDWNKTINNNKHFGWRVRRNFIENSEEQTVESNLKVAEQLTVKKKDEPFETNPQLFSKFYDLDQQVYHFVLFGMQWCQPVWDGLLDSNSPTNIRSTARTFVNRKINGEWRKDLNMHIVTAFSGGQYNPYGHYYGFYSDQAPCHRAYTGGADKKHRGVDVFSGESGENPSFAVHGGQIQNRLGYGFGYWAKIWIQGYEVGANFILGHLKAPAGFDNKDVVMAGQKVGTCGRTFGNSDNAQNPGEKFSNHHPSHLHFEFRSSASLSDSVEPSSYLDTNDPNRVVLPDNTLPLMLPCQCKYGGSYQGPSNCQAVKGVIVKSCWAIREFPYDNTTMENSSHNNPSKHQDKFVNDDDVTLFACPYIHYKYQAELNTTLNTSSSTSITVDRDISDFPDSGELLIDEEVISYTGKDIGTNTFTGCTREAYSTEIAQHAVGSPVTYLNFEVFWTQAHLKFAYENMGQNNIPQDLLNPGGIDNSMSTSLAQKTINLEADDEIEIITQDGNQAKIKKKGTADSTGGWVMNHEDLTKVEDEKIKMKQKMKHVLSSKVTSSTCKAIYQFRTQENLTIKTEEDYADNFYIDATLVIRLRQRMVEIPIQ